MVPEDGDHFARGAYTIEVFNALGALVDTETQLLESLGPREARHVRQVLNHAGNA
jgi:hypothetical protein